MAKYCNITSVNMTISGKAMPKYSYKWPSSSYANLGPDMAMFWKIMPRIGQVIQSYDWVIQSCAKIWQSLAKLQPNMSKLSEATTIYC